MDEDVVVWWLLRWLSQFLTPELVVRLVLAVLLVGTAALVVGGALFLRYRRHPSVQRALLRLRSEHVPSDLQAEVIDLRLDLRDELEVARRAVASVDEAGELAGELPALLRRLQQAADRLDRNLQVLERSVETGGSYRSLAPARRQVADVVAAARDIRRAALAALDVTTSGEIQSLTRAVEQEVAWVQSGVAAMDDLLGPERTRTADGPPIGDRRRRGGRPRRG